MNINDFISSNSICTPFDVISLQKQGETVTKSDIHILVTMDGYLLRLGLSPPKQYPMAQGVNMTKDILTYSNDLRLLEKDK
jgi:hypothetical protein